MQWKHSCLMSIKCKDGVLTAWVVFCAGLCSGARPSSLAFTDWRMAKMFLEKFCSKTDRYGGLTPKIILLFLSYFSSLHLFVHFILHYGLYLNLVVMLTVGITTAGDGSLESSSFISPKVDTNHRFAGQKRECVSATHFLRHITHPVDTKMQECCENNHSFA